MQTRTGNRDDGAGGSADGGMTGLRRWIGSTAGRLCRDHPWVCAIGGVALTLLGGLLFLQSTSERDLPISILWAVLGGGVGMVGLLLINELVATFVRALPRQGRRYAVAAFAVGVIGVALAISAGSSWMAIVAAGPILLSLLAANALLVTASTETRQPLVGAGAAALAVGVLVGLWGNGLDRRSIVGLGIWAVGLVLFKVGVPAWIDGDDNHGQREARTGPALIASVVATVIGVGLLYLASSRPTQAGLLVGLTLVVAGLSAVGIAGLRVDLGGARAWAVLAVGLVFIALGAWQVRGIVSLGGLTLLAVVVVAGIGAWYVFRGEALVALLLLAFVLGWVLVDRNSDAPADPVPAGDLEIVALGDSYISGEGAPRYLAGTNISGVGNNACRRAPTAYPYLVADRLGASLHFVACSGARTVNMDNDDQPRPLPDPVGPIAGGEDQLQWLLADRGDRIADVDAVIVSIGGNDVYFGNIVQACLLPQTCAVDDRTGPWLDNAREVEDTLVDAYTRLRQVFGADTPIVAVLYPQVVAPADGCQIIIGSDEIAFVQEFTAELNGSIRRAGARAGINVFEGSEDAFAGRGLCDDDPATNSLHLSPTDGPILDRLSPANWVHGSMHPRASGHELIAERLVGTGGSDGYLVELLGSTPPNPEPAGGPDVGPIGEPPTEETIADQDWVMDRLYETIAELVVPVGLLVVGGLLAALGLLATRLPLVDILRPSDA